MTAVAEDEPPAPELLEEFIGDGRAWVHVDEQDVPVGYVIVELVDGCAHIEQVSVDPSHSGRGVGAGLVDHVGAWARKQGAAALTLTTFTDVPWNGPYYGRRGFRWLEDAEITPGLREIRAAEAAHGLDRWPRGCMRREL
ncbi:GNAT family N-acetyltransferase [Streptomyces sp. UNOC14_S4]|nr:GNAT family N-acetyltransferase [Streptomyces sp. UNOC14_S4]